MESSSCVQRKERWRARCARHARTRSTKATQHFMSVTHNPFTLKAVKCWLGWSRMLPTRSVSRSHSSACARLRWQSDRAAGGRRVSRAVASSRASEGENEKKTSTNQYKAAACIPVSKRGELVAFISQWYLFLTIYNSA